MTPSRYQSASNDTGGAPHSATGSDGSISGGQQVHLRRSFSLAFRNWRVRSKLVAILLIPLIAVLGFAGLRLRDMLEAQRQAHRAEQMAQFSGRVVVLARDLESERDQSAVSLGTSHQNGSSQLRNARDATDKQVSALQQSAGALEIRSLSPVLSDLLGTVDNHINTLNGLRLSVDTNGDWSSVDAEYQSFVADLLALEQHITQGVDDSQLNDAVQALNAVSRYLAASDSERGLVGFLIANGAYSESDRTEVFRRDAQGTVAKGVVDSTLTTVQRRVFDKALPETLTDPVSRLEDGRLLPTPAGRKLPVAIDEWYQLTGAKAQALAGVEDALTAQVLDRTRQLGSAARKQALIDGLIVVGILLATFLLAMLTARSLVRPLRRLRSRALDVAYTELPSAVQRMRDADHVDPAPTASLGVDSRDEVGEVAEAFDSVHREAVRHAGEQALLRRNVSTMFVNLSRRTQSLVERQLRLIDTLEGSEQDPDSLENLFQLDHLATRMRRNAENLLVLAGSEPGRRWTQPVALIDVLRAAAAEVEQYQRVVHTFVTGREVEGRAVGDVVHLVAELLENATEFSPPDTHVVVSARSMSGGAGVMIEIEDQGIGMSGEDMASANERLSATTDFEPQLSRMMGLYVVGRLAARHGIRVQLRPAPSGGLTALIHLPPEVVVDPMSQTGADLPPMTSPPVAAGALLGPDEDPAHPGTELPGPVVRPGAGQPATPLPTFGLAGLTAGTAAVPRPPITAPQPIVSSGPPSGPVPVPVRFGPNAGGPYGGPPGFPTGPATGSQPALPPLPRREPNAAWPPGGPITQPAAAPAPEPAKDEPEPPRQLLPSREAAAAAATPVEPDGDIVDGLPATAASGAEGALTDLDEDTIVPHGKDEDLPIFAGLESEWFMRREEAPLPPPPGLPLEEWGISLEDLPAPAESLASAARGGAVAPETRSEPAPVRNGMEGQALRSANGPGQPLPALPVRPRPAAPGQPPSTGEPAWVGGPPGPGAVVPPDLAARPGAGTLPPSGPAPDQPPGDGGQPRPPTRSAWVSPADEGWRAAERLSKPTEGGTTDAGLPIRVPMAHFVPGAAPTPLRQSAAAQARGQAASQTQPRSPDAVRGMLSSYQRGLRQGREAGRHREQETDETYANQEHS